MKGCFPVPQYRLRLEELYLLLCLQEPHRLSFPLGMQQKHLYV